VSAVLTGTALVLGANGFLGSHVTRELVGEETLLAVAPGGYFLIASGDVNGTVFESNEGNNTLVQAITVTP
jgi:uncharacterized protein YbjT (DUF2867 family)